MLTTVRVDSLTNRKWREIQQQPGTSRPGNMLGCCLIPFHFLWSKLSTRTVEVGIIQHKNNTLERYLLCINSCNISNVIAMAVLLGPAEVVHFGNELGVLEGLPVHTQASSLSQYVFLCPYRFYWEAFAERRSLYLHSSLSISRGREEGSGW